MGHKYTVCSVKRLTRLPNLSSLPNGIFLSHSIGVKCGAYLTGMKSLLHLFHRAG
jgi:hypothetical protein